MARFPLPELTLPISFVLRRFVRVGLTAICLGAICAFPVIAQAHAILMESVPPADGSMKAGPATLRFRFNSRIDQIRSRLTLIRPDHSEIQLIIDPDTNDEVLETHADLPAGKCSVRWQVLAVDGHITRGDMTFTVLPVAGH